MGAALAIRGDISAAELRRLARLDDDGRVACRLLALANALDGMSRAVAAERAGPRTPLAPAALQTAHRRRRCRTGRRSGIG